ncbi:MAG: cysteine desulfurase NifS [Clostridiales bacterium]|nr:cysteine desulfurase NifS [Clostridiales bacterium]
MNVYFDNAATTSVSETALNAMLPCLKENYGNASSLHALGQEANRVLDESRQTIASLIGANPSELYFTSGGSEADNWIITQMAYQGRRKGKIHLISTAFEHHAVLHTLKKLEKEGFEVTLLPVHEDGLVRPEELDAAITDKTALVTIMYANNEIGTIQPITELAAISHKHGVFFHTDAVQAVGHLPIDVKAQGIDALSMSGHKFHGVKGTGALYCRKGVLLGNLIEGGAQERGKRAGTENIPGIVAMAAALQEACDHMEENAARVTAMRDKLIAGVLQIPNSRLNGDPVKRLPGNASFCFEGVEGESLLLRLDLAGVCASSGSACTSGSLDPSHVLLAIGLPTEVAHGSLRLTLDEVNTEEEVDYVLEKLPGIVRTLRNMSPVWEDMIEAGTAQAY